MGHFSLSVTEDEIQNGILEAKNTNKTCYWFKRKLTDLPEHTGDKMARRFMDMAGGVDEEALRFLTRLKLVWQTY